LLCCASNPARPPFNLPEDTEYQDRPPVVLDSLADALNLLAALSPTCYANALTNIYCALRTHTRFLTDLLIHCCILQRAEPGLCYAEGCIGNRTRFQLIPALDCFVADDSDATLSSHILNLPLPLRCLAAVGFISQNKDFPTSKKQRINGIGDCLRFNALQGRSPRYATQPASSLFSSAGPEIGLRQVNCQIVEAMITRSPASMAVVKDCLG
jgi:hypothetical protein